MTYEKKKKKTSMNAKNICLYETGKISALACKIKYI